jgi:hypothetical protein
VEAFPAIGFVANVPIRSGIEARLSIQQSNQIILTQNEIIQSIGLN